MYKILILQVKALNSSLCTFIGMKHVHFTCIYEYHTNVSEASSSSSSSSSCFSAGQRAGQARKNK